MKRKRDSIASARANQRSNDEAESHELGHSFACLPSSVTTHILLLLPIKSVLICRCVCRTWNALISDPHFAKLHFEHAPVSLMIRTNDPRRVSRTLHLLEYEPEKYESDDEEGQFCCCEDDFLNPECNNHVELEPKFKLPLRDAKLVLQKRDKTKNGGRQRRYIACKPRDDKFGVVNSCNGLLCLCDPRNKDPLVVCNPVTGEFIRLPEATRIEKTLEPIYAGFGFQPKTNEYKVIRMWKRYVQSPRDARALVSKGVVVEMHKLGTPIWRNIGVDLEFSIAGLEFPTCLNGALHWINFDRSILCFNLESDRLQSFPSPPRALEYNGIHHEERTSMGELGGFLYICDSSIFDAVVMWVMKKYGIGESWTKVFSIDALDRDRWPYGLYWPVKHFKKGASILMYHSCNCFIYYEPEKYGFKFYQVHGTQSKFEVIPHIPSLVSLKDAVKGDNIDVLNVHSRCAKFKLREEDEFLFLAQENVDLASLYSSSSDCYGEE